VTVTVVDGNGNVLANAPVTITVPGSGKYSTQPANGLTNSQGQLVINYTNTKAGTENYPVSINNSQEMAVLTFKADSSTARVAQVVLQDAQTSKVANGVNTFTYQALVTDAQGNPLDNMSVAWTQNKGALVSLLNTTTQTNAQGLTSVVLQSTDKVATNIVVSGSVNNTLQAADKVTNFTADIQSAAVVSVTLVDTVTSKVADGKNTFTFKALVKDSGGNPVPNVNVNWQSTPLTSSVIFASSSQTNDDGIATITVTSTTTAVADLLISASSIAGAGVDANQKVSFTADTSTARVVSVVLDDAVTEKVANGTNTFTYTAKVEDANGNPVKGVLVAWSKTVGASLLPAFPGTVTDAEGMASVVLSSTTKMDLNIQVSAQVGATTKIKADKVVSFTADSSTAKVSTVTLVGTDVSQVANGTNAFTYTVTVVDTHGNPVAGATVTPASDKTNVNVTVN
ncbi:Ig-like domain-containing protein, partial [Providencia alcalifaciens]|uniref:Ig-like domain-containing protein n=1 Tax=Providencia alcalifaciens TaxID=126385 RepID=UPI003D2B91CC